MKLLDKITAFFGFNQKSKETAAQEEALRRSFKARGDHFKALLAANKRALEAMATLEEDMRGERFFSMGHVRANCTVITVNVYQMIKHLHELTKNSDHLQLLEKWKEIQARIQAVIAPKSFICSGPYILDLKEIGFAHAHEVGEKMASLGEASQQLHQVIPDGFVITASAFYRFLEANKLQEEISKRIQMTDISQLEGLFTLSEQIQQLIFAATIPEDLSVAIMRQYGQLVDTHGSLRLAVRSSAIGEDSLNSSFAGQYRTELNVTGDTLLEMYKTVIASKYGVSALAYRFNRGIPDDAVPMCVGCLRMVDAQAGGVVYSADPLGETKAITVNAVLGLPKTVVDGSADFDTFIIDKDDPTHIHKECVVRKKEKLVCDSDAGLKVIPLTREEGSKASLTPAQLLELAELALRFEEFYGIPQDIEWAYAEDDTLIILQSRALQITKPFVRKTPSVPHATLLLEGGVCASPGASFGKIVLVRREEDMLYFPKNSILLVEQAHARWAPLLSRASGVISEAGGIAGHLASVAREYGIPAIFSLSNAVALLHPGEEITLDADSGRIYKGREESFLNQAEETHKFIFAGSPVYTSLAQAMHHIAPLRLLYPESPTFAPAFCESLHDITRYCHEKAVEEMFRVDESIFSGRCGKQLRYNNSKLQYFVVNLGSGFCSSVEGQYIDIEQICSIPMLAIWEGMLAVPWSGPPAASVRGFLSVVMESAANPDLEVTSASMRMTKNYFMIDREYCNLQASFGYHFCTVEAQAGPDEQENYVSFHFKGGAANLARRRWRVQVVADILAENGFIVDVKEDALSARTEDLSADEACELLAILGFLLIHTRQMDASLHNETNKNTFADILRKGIAKTLQVYGVKLK